MKQRIAQRLQRAIDEKVFPGCVAGFAVNGMQPEFLAAGRHTYDAGSPEMTRDSIFDVASITKAIPTSSLSLLCIDRGMLGLNDRLARYVPEFKGVHRDTVLVRHLLTQTLSFGHRLSALRNQGAEAILEAITSPEILEEPGSRYAYANATSILLGMVVEKVFGESLAVSAQREFFDPLRMTRTTFFPERFSREEIVPTEIDSWRGRIVHGEIHDESAYILRKVLVAGSAGLFSTAPDILCFLTMLLNGGALWGREFFSQDCLDLMRTNQIGPMGLTTGLGWELDQSRYMGTHFPKNTIGKTGFTGCVCMCNIPQRMAMVLLSNYTFPARKADSQTIDCVRRDVADIIFGPQER